MKLLPHQTRYATDRRNKILLVHEVGTGKSVCASLWLKNGRDSNALVICPKRIIDKWKQTLIDWGTKATVLSKEQFKKEPLKQWSAVVVDEIDEFASPLFTKQRSQLSTALYNLVKTYPDMPIVGLTATPIRSSPNNLHTLLCYIGVYFDHKKWQSTFFNLERRPFLSRPAYFPKPNWHVMARKILEKHSDIVLMKDCVDYLPPVTENVIEVKNDPFERTEIEPSATFVAEHRHEQQNKLKIILDIAKGYRKVMVVAHYVEQVENLYKELSKDRKTYMVHGSVKEQEKILKEANEDDECFLVLQASLGVGFDADSFSCVIFASMSYKVRDLVQMRGRVRRIKNLHPVEYNFILGGRCDKAVYDTLMKNRDFVPSEFNATRTTQN